jgi:transposase
MYVKKNRNRSGSVTVQIIDKSRGKYKLLKTIGHATEEKDIKSLCQKAKLEIYRLQLQPSLFVFSDDALIESFVSTIGNNQIMVIGPELIFGKIYDAIGYNEIPEELFRHLVITRLVYPGSKLKTIDYLRRYQNVHIGIDNIYRFLDKLQSRYKNQVEQISFAHTRKILQGRIGVVFYDMTTLYFEASEEDELRKTGFSKDGKHQQPQIYLGLLVGQYGYAIGYEIFDGAVSEGHTLIPVIERMQQKFHIEKPIIVADAGLLSNDNIMALEENHYQYILGGRIKNESASVKKKILQESWSDGKYCVIRKGNRVRLIVSYSDKRAKKDEHNRMRGLQRLEKRMKSGKLTKSNINNKGYNKYLKLKGEIMIEIDYEKFYQDKCWDGLKGYVTNATLNSRQIISHYRNLWQIEKAFRISKTDLKIRPIFHRIQNRIEAHICISFTAYSIYKELERVLENNNAPFSVIRAAELTHTMYQIGITLPESQRQVKVLLKMDEQQQQLKKIIEENF